MVYDQGMKTTQDATEVKLTDRQQLMLDQVVAKGGTHLSAHEERVGNALVIKGLLTVRDSTVGQRTIGWYEPTDTGRANTRHAKNMRRLHAYAAKVRAARAGKD